MLDALMGRFPDVIQLLRDDHPRVRKLFAEHEKAIDGHKRGVSIMNPRREAEMNVVLPICCFCEKVRDDAGTGSGQGPWQDMKNYKVSRGLRPLETVFAYGCCPECLEDDPRASAFRTRNRPAGASLRAGRYTENAFASSNDQPIHRT